MFNKVAEGVVQGILIAAIGFSTATVWKAFQSSTEDLRIAKSQLNSQVQRNQQLIDFNKNQKEVNAELLSITNQQSEDLKKLAETIVSLNATVQKLSTQLKVKVDKTVSEKLVEVEKSVESRKATSASVQQQQQQQQLIYGQMQQQQQQQQQIQQKWH
ncbi:hypothetical protein [Teredinibacter sp. KSP-S5-2]|uniref:hypothetical protein n=1 Tax=Teredinibacter sp. KSP-S5-2 TaxID=3034506 RepID=UPI002934FBEC|nr:hypothetical protein [Teredinibacter sp. KSP-S5-2]WNO09974.1 hypothetical protein P5V12_02195 [Teredinibacter sp. KSP-S5-2]